MNVIVANKYQQSLTSLEIDIIKTMYGEFEVDEIISTFKNFFYQRMILDITAIKNHKDPKTLQKLSISLDMDKIIVLLSDEESVSSPSFLSQLVSMGIYNFTRNNEGIMYLYNHPNSYRDVAHVHQLGSESSPGIMNHGTHNQNSGNVNIVQEEIIANNQFQQIRPSGPKIIGIKNAIKESGATTLTYMMKKELTRNYSVVAIEVEKRDFRYFNDKDLVTSTEVGLNNAINENYDKEIILIDINESKIAEKVCSDIIYLLEPSTIKLNKAMFLNKNLFVSLKGKKIVLNQSMLDSSDVLEFEREAQTKIFFNMPALNERETNNYSLNMFLNKLGFERQEVGEVTEKKKKWGLF